jgi:hypothetical protein
MIETSKGETQSPARRGHNRRIQETSFKPKINLSLPVGWLQNLAQSQARKNQIDQNRQSKDFQI